MSAVFSNNVHVLHVKMPRGLQLTRVEIGEINALKEQKLSNREIAKRIGRSRSVVNNFINLGPFYGKIKRSGRKRTVSPRLKRLMISKATIENMNAGQIKAELNLQIGVRRVHQILYKKPQPQIAIVMKKPKLTPKHIKARLEFARNHMSWTDAWRQVIFSDERKFNLDGPDGCQYYWHDLRTEKQIRMSRNFVRDNNNNNVMVWLGFSYKGMTPVCFISTKMEPAMYIELLEDALIEHGDRIAGPDWIFQQNNASIHASSGETRTFLSERNIDAVDFPSIFPDMNPMENLWGILARKVYANGRQFDTVNGLKNQIKQSCAEVDIKVLEKLIDSMPDRIFDLIKANGRDT